MNITTRLAWRNLWRHGRRTWLTVGAMVFCNALLVCLIAFQIGSYRLMIDASLATLTGHLQVQHPDFLEEPRMRFTVPGGEALASQLRKESILSGAAARASAFALASSDERSFGVQVLGVQAEYERGLSTLPGLVSEGRYLSNGNAAEIVIGSVLARNLKAGIGAELTLLGSGRDGSFAAGVVTVVGIISSGFDDIDRVIAQVPLVYFQDIFAMGDHVHTIVARVDYLSEVAAAKTRVRALLGSRELAVWDWNKLEPGLQQAILADLASAFIMYAVLIVLVAFSVLNTQLMSVLERTREFGVMMALGLRPGGLARLVFAETASMSALGLCLGCAIGGAISAYLMAYGITIPGMEAAMEQYNLPATIYPELNLISLLLGPAAVFTGCMLAAVYPALRLYTLRPVSAMRAV